MTQIVFFLEEPSARAMLEGFLPKIMPKEVYRRYIVFEGKQDLEKQLVRRMRGYLVPGARFIVLRDQDAANCKTIKAELVKKCVASKRVGTLVRIACHELESWYLADLAAVEKGFGLSGLARRQSERNFYSPDAHPSPAHTLRQIVPSYQKVGGSRCIGPHLDPDNERSRSFAAFVSGVRRLCKNIA